MHLFSKQFMLVVSFSVTFIFNTQVLGHPLTAATETESTDKMTKPAPAVETPTVRHSRQLFTLLLGGALAYDVLNHYMQSTTPPPAIPADTAETRRPTLDEAADAGIRRLVQTVAAIPERVAYRAQEILNELASGNSSTSPASNTSSASASESLIRLPSLQNIFPVLNSSNPLQSPNEPIIRLPSLQSLRNLLPSRRQNTTASSQFQIGPVIRLPTLQSLQSLFPSRF